MAKHQRRSSKRKKRAPAPRSETTATPAPDAAPHAPAASDAVDTGTQSARARWTLLALVVAVAAAGALLHLGSRDPGEETGAGRASHKPSRPAGNEPGEAPTAPRLTLDQVMAKTVGQTPDSSYVGSKVCAECHEEERDAWMHDWHGKALAPARGPYVAGDFNDVHYAGTSSEAWMRHDKERFVMYTRDRQGQFDTYPVHWLIGGKHMQDPVTVFADGRWQVLPVYYHVRGSKWVDYTEDKQGRLYPDHPFFWTNFRRTANHECLDCHVTGLRVGYDRDTHTWTTRFVDPGVGCEACHGPGKRHAETLEPAHIIKPSKLDPERELAVCGQCHGIHKPLFATFDHDHHFRPGDRYEDYYEIITAVTSDSRGLLSDFFVDGRPNSSSYEYLSLVQSACHRKGKATCLSCHTPPHEKHDTSEVRIASDEDKGVWSNGDHTCRQCHESVFAAGTRHTRHRAAAAQSCVSCHMPKVLKAVKDTFADHAIDVPDPENTVRHNIPNACNVCHTDRSAKDMAAAVTRMWPRAHVRQARRRRIADALAEGNDARALAALGEVLSDRSEAASLRGAAALRLSQRFPREAPDLLMKHMGDPDPLVRAQCIEGLGITRSKSAAPAIEQYVGDPSVLVRWAAALTLAGMRAPAGEQALHDLAEDPATATMAQPQVGRALYALGRNDLDAALDALERVVRVQPYNTSALLMMADVNVARQHVDEALRDLDEVLRFDPGNKAARKLRATLDAR